ncbi:hypothetical protein Unana1_00524 [Umbelopsis nana]
MDHPVTKSDEGPTAQIADSKLDIRDFESEQHDPRITQEKERRQGLGDDVRGGSDLGQNLAPDMVTKSLGMAAECGSKKQK